MSAFLKALGITAILLAVVSPFAAIVAVGLWVGGVFGFVIATFGPLFLTIWTFTAIGEVSKGKTHDR